MNRGVLFSTPGIHDPQNLCDPKWKSQLSAPKAITTAQGRGSRPGRKTGRPERCLCSRVAGLHFPTSTHPAGPQRPLGHLGLSSKQAGPTPGSVNSALLSSLPARAAGHPLPLGPGLFGNNGGNIKQGLKTGSESLGSQGGSLEGAEQQEGPWEAGPLGGLAGWEEDVLGCSLLTPVWSAQTARL